MADKFNKNHDICHTRITKMARITNKIGITSYFPGLYLSLCVLLLAANCIFSSFSYSQVWTMPVDGKVYGGGEKLSGSIVTLYKNSQQLQQIVTTTNGRFSFELAPNAEYIISVTKPGYITKKFKINTANVPTDRAAAGGFNPFEPDVTLFEMPTAPEISKRVEAILSQPIAIYQYIPAETNFNYDEKYTNVIQAKLAELAQLQKQVEKEVQEKAKNTAVEAQKQLEVDKKYKAAIAKGDAALTSKDYTAAKSGYNEALGIKPGEAYPKLKLTEIDKLMADAGKQKEIDAKYQTAISKGDGAFGTKDYASAKTAYVEASGIKPGEAYPKTKIAEIDKLLADANKQKDLDAKYQAAITKGDGAFGTKDYTSAKTAYVEASGIKPGEAYPKTKIAEIDKLLAEANKQKDLDAKYQAAITKGDGAFGSKDYVSAKTAYTEALNIKPGEAYPKTKIAEIDKLLSGAEVEKQKELQYKNTIAKADASFAEKDYSGAKSAYAEASGLKPAEVYPKSRIAEIDKILAEMAKAGDREKQYKDLIAKADNSFAQKEYTSARTSYSNASSLKSAEQYPKAKIAEIDKLLSEGNKQKELDAKYQAAITKGDNSFSAKDYSTAKAGYTEASGIKPNETYPRTKIAEIDKLLAEMANQKSASEKEQQYKDAIVKGDRFFTSKEYENSKAAYNEALSLKPAEQYPKNKIAEIDKLLAGAGRQKELDAKYQAAIEKGDNGFNSKDYSLAKAGYTEAVTIKSAEAYPKTKLAEIDKLIANAANSSAQSDVDVKYKATIVKGDKAFIAKDYVTARPMYIEASRIKPLEQYPKDKLAEITTLEKNLVEEQEQNETSLQYNQAIVRADKSFSKKDYNNAKLSYEDALIYKPDEKYPKDRIKLISEIIRKQTEPKQVVKKEPKQALAVVPVVSEEEKIKVYQSELRTKYPTGVTEEEYTNNGKTILRRVVIKSDFAGIYTKVTHNWGGVYCFRDNVPITEVVFENETR